jgi:hypothetical protein
MDFSHTIVQMIIVYNGCALFCHRYMLLGGETGGDEQKPCSKFYMHAILIDG